MCAYHEHVKARLHDAEAVSLPLGSDAQTGRLETKAQLLAEIRQDLEATNAYLAEHGSFAELARQHYRGGDED